MRKATCQAEATIAAIDRYANGGLPQVDRQAMGIDNKSPDHSSSRPSIPSGGTPAAACSQRSQAACYDVMGND